MTLRIAIDLDNTIIDYGSLFHALASERGWISSDVPPNKAAIRAAVVDGSDDQRWQALQADAYGPKIDGAVLSAGVLAFVDGARAAGHELFILSHKTERSRFSPSVSLRESAVRWLERSDLLGDERVPHEAVHFFEDRDAKVRAVAGLGIDWVVDDLREVLEHPGLPTTTVRIWFHAGSDTAASLVRCGCFAEVAALLQLHDELGVVPTTEFREALGSNPQTVAPLVGGGNAALGVVVDDDGGRRVVKSYSRRGEGRAEREHRALRWLRDVGMSEVPASHYVDAAAEVGVIEYVDGRRPEPADGAGPLADKCASFILRLAERGRDPYAQKAFGPATDARFTLASYRTAIERRLAEVNGGARSGRAQALLRDRVEPLAAREIAAFEARVRASSLDPERPLEGRMRIPSPSDFGLHNAILDRYDRLWFVDFEYFGWDDPAKLMADFRHSVANTLPPEARERFVDRVALGLDGGPALRERLDVVSNLVRLEWILIVLNVLTAEAEAADARVLRRLARAERMVEAFA